MNIVSELVNRWVDCCNAAHNKDQKSLDFSIKSFNWLYKKATYSEQGEFHHEVATTMGFKV